MPSSQPHEPSGQRPDLQGCPTHSGRSPNGSFCPSWAQELHYFEGKLSAADFALLDQHMHAKPLTTDVLLASTLSCVETYDRRWFQETLRKLDPLFDHIKSFSSIVDVFVQTNPAISGLIWGSVHLAITVGLHTCFSNIRKLPNNTAAGLLSVNGSFRNIYRHARGLCADPVVLQPLKEVV
jgi:hypothetical protein